MDDLGTFLHFFPNSHRDWDKETELEEKMYEHIRNAPIPVAPGSEKYFRGSLHDGYVYGIERDKNDIFISIGDSEIDQLARIVDEEMDIERDVDYSPVRLVFEGVNYVNGVRPDPDGWLKWDDWENWDSGKDWFVRCWFHEQEGKIQWIGVFCKMVKGRMKQSGDLYILIDCEAVKAKPESERALRKRYGDVCYDAMVMIQALPQEERWLYMGHLKRHLDAKGIHRRTIPHQSER